MRNHRGFFLLLAVPASEAPPPPSQSHAAAAAILCPFIWDHECEGSRCLVRGLQQVTSGVVSMVMITLALKKSRFLFSCVVSLWFLDKKKTNKNKLLMTRS